MKFRLFGITDVGRVRDHNEDNFAVCKDLDKGEWNYDRSELRELSDRGAVMIVADGMGGTNAGEIASDIAQKTVKKQFDELKKVPRNDEKILNLLGDFIIEAHDKIVEHQKNYLDTAGMGTTMVVAWVLGKKLYVSWSGDSRCYVFNNDTPAYPFTDDHSQVWEMVKNNHMTPEEARVHPESNLITQNLGDPSQPPQPEGKCVNLQPGDRILVCSDGLNGMLSDADIHYTLVEEQETSEACKKLVESAKNAGGHDNITVLLFDVDPDKKSTSPEIPRTVKQTSLTNKKNKGGGVNLFLAAGFVLMAALLGYQLLFGNQQSGESRNVILGTQYVELGDKKEASLELGSVFLPFGPQIMDTQIIREPSFGKATLEGTVFNYILEDDTSSSVDRFSIKMHSKNNVSFVASYEIKWNLPAVKKAKSAFPDTTEKTASLKADSADNEESDAATPEENIEEENASNIKKIESDSVKKSEKQNSN